MAGNQWRRRFDLNTKFQCWYRIKIILFLLFCEMRNMLKWYTTFYLNYTSSQPTWVFMIVQITERLWQIQTTKTFHISKTQYKQARRQLQPSFNYLEARQTSNEGYIYIYNTCALSKHIGNMCMRLRNKGKGEASPSLFLRFAPNTHLSICFDSAHVLYLSCNFKS